MQYVVGMYSNLGMSARKIRIWIMKQATCFGLYASSPLSLSDPNTDEGPFGLASVFRQERRSAGSDVNSINVEVGWHPHFSLAVRTITNSEYRRRFGIKRSDTRAHGRLKAFEYKAKTL